jgi:hypothetical protein
LSTEAEWIISQAVARGRACMLMLLIAAAIFLYHNFLQYEYVTYIPKLQCNLFLKAIHRTFHHGYRKVFEWIDWWNWAIV